MPAIMWSQNARRGRLFEEKHRALVVRRLPMLRVGSACRHRALPKLLGGNEAGTDNFAPAPHQRAHPKNLAASGKRETEQLRHPEPPDFQASPGIGTTATLPFTPSPAH